MNPGKFLHIAEDGDTVAPYNILDRVVVNKAQAGAVINIFDGTTLIASIDGNVAGSKEYGLKTADSIIISPTGFTSCDATVVVRNV